MSRSALAVFAFVSLLILAVDSGQSQPAQGPSRVIVTNFPPLQEIRGEVAVPQPVPHSAFRRVGNDVVPPVSRVETARMIDLGPIDTAGFTALTLSLQGEMKSSPARSGQVGVVLVPDEAPFVEAFAGERRLLLTLEVGAEVISNEEGSFAASERLEVGFPRYRAYLFNTTDRSAEVNVYAYLVH